MDFIIRPYRIEILKNKPIPREEGDKIAERAAYEKEARFERDIYKAAQGMMEDAQRQAANQRFFLIRCPWK